MGRRTPLKKARLKVLLLIEVVKICPEIKLQYWNQRKREIYSYLQHIYECKSNCNSNIERKRKIYVVTCSRANGVLCWGHCSTDAASSPAQITTCYIKLKVEAYHENESFRWWNVILRARIYPECEEKTVWEL